MLFLWDWQELLDIACVHGLPTSDGYIVVGRIRGEETYVHLLWRLWFVKRGET